MIRILEITIDDPLYAEERTLRVKVLREPLGMPGGTEFFPFETESRHFLAMNGEAVVGCVLFHPRPPTGKLFQMAVYPEYQGKGVGKLLVEYLEREAIQSGLTSVFCHARWEVRQFYAGTGYCPVGEEFVEIGIRHVKMVKRLQR
jgi:predicted GNAT family N-acyltransferase